MRRQLPSHPHLEHLKSQAKDLLSGQRRGDREALNRIRALVPAFANCSDDAIAKGPFALHDAQSAIAREYGFNSWAELRAHVSDAHSAYQTLVIRSLSGAPVASELADAVRHALAERGMGLNEPTPESLPVLPLRNALIFPGAIVPLDIGRPKTLRAIEAALEVPPAFLGVFAQRAFETENPNSEDLHPTGCLCIVRYFNRVSDGSHAWTLVEGMRWVTLDALEQVEPYCRASIANTGVDRGDPERITVLENRLRETARRVAERMPVIREPVLTLISTTSDIGQLADFVISSFPSTVANLAAYADEKQLEVRLERVIELLETELAKLGDVR